MEIYKKAHGNVKCSITSLRKQASKFQTGNWSPRKEKRKRLRLESQKGYSIG